MVLNAHYNNQSHPYKMAVILVQKLEAENAEQLQIVMAVVNRIERLEESLRALQEQQAQQQQSKWGVFSLHRH